MWKIMIPLSKHDFTLMELLAVIIPLGKRKRSDSSNNVYVRGKLARL